MSESGDPYSTHAPLPSHPAMVRADYADALVVRTSKLAVASLVVGIIAVLACFIPIVPGVIAFVLGLMAIQRTGPMKLAGRGLAMAGLVLGCVAVFLSILSLSVWLPALARGREETNRTKCASNLQQIGAALQSYAADNDGSLPPDLWALLAPPNAQLQSAELLCPSTDHSLHAGPLVLGKNLSYIYTGRGLLDAQPADYVLLYEPVEHHRRDGANFLFADGSSRFIERTQARAMIQLLERGINPPNPNPATTGVGNGDESPPSR